MSFNIIVKWQLWCDTNWSRCISICSWFGSCCLASTLPFPYLQLLLHCRLWVRLDFSSSPASSAPRDSSPLLLPLLLSLRQFSIPLFIILLFFPQETNSESNHKTVIPGSTKFKPGRICVLECCSSPSLTSLTPLPRCVLTHAQAYPTGKWQGAARGNGLQRYKTLHSVSQGMDEVEEEVPNPKQTLHVHLWLCTHSSLNLQETKSRWEAQLDKAAWIFTLLHANDGTWARV